MDDGVLTFFVAGIPRTQGSKRAVMSRNRDPSKRRALLIGDRNDAELMSWREAIANEARARFHTLLDGPVLLNLLFLLPRPARKLRHERPVAMRSGDVDKLMRAVMDALTGVVYADDASVAVARVEKKYAPRDAQTGVYIQVGLTS